MKKRNRKQKRQITRKNNKKDDSFHVPVWIRENLYQEKFPPQRSNFKITPWMKWKYGAFQKWKALEDFFIETSVAEVMMKGVIILCAIILVALILH